MTSTANRTERGSAGSNLCEEGLIRFVDPALPRSVLFCTLSRDVDPALPRSVLFDTEGAHAAVEVAAIDAH